MLKICSTAIVIFASLFSVAAYAGSSNLVAIDDTSVVAIVMKAIAPATDILVGNAIKWLGAFALIQLLLTNLGMLKSGSDMEAIIGKTAGSILWFGFCFYLVDHAPGFIQDVGNQFFIMVGIHYGIVASISAGIIALATTIITIGSGLGVTVAGVGDPTLASLVVNIGVAFLLVGLYFAVKIFMLQLELALVVMLSPLSFSFLGLNALKDQGIAPFKSLISLGYRILITSVLLSAFSEVFHAVKTTINSFEVLTNPTTIVHSLLSGLAAFGVLTYLLYKSDSIAASLASGSTNMGAGDVAAAAAAGAAAGALTSSGSAAAVKAPQLMSDVMNNLRSSGSVSNATPGSGRGGPIAGMNSPSPSSSLKPGGAGSDTAGGGAMDVGNPSSPNFCGPPAPPENPCPRIDTPLGVATDSAAGGSGASAAIGGGANEGSLAQTLDKLSKSMDAMNSPKSKTFGDHASTLNNHVAQEKAATHVSISAHHSD